MASKDSSNNTSRTAPKRLARAKVKHPVTEADTKKGAAKTKDTATKSAQATTTGKSSAKATAEDRKSFWIKVGIGAFAVLMALSMMLPSLASIVSGAQQASSSAQTETTTEADTTDETTTDETATDETAETEESEGETVDTATGVAQIDAAYETQVSSLETKLESDNKNLAALLNLGKLYMQWGAGASYYASTDEENAHVAELFEKAIGYYDRYLEINEDNSVKVDHALCQLYAGDIETAQAELEKLTEDAPDYGLAWANLGMIYEYSYNTEAAKAAYQKAIETDPNDEYGASSYASSRLASLNEAELENSSDSVETTTTGTGLTDTLSDSTGIGF